MTLTQMRYFYEVCKRKFFAFAPKKVQPAFFFQIGHGDGNSWLRDMQTGGSFSDTAPPPQIFTPHLAFYFSAFIIRYDNNKVKYKF